MTAAPHMLDSLRRKSAVYVAEGFPPIPAPWLKEAARFYNHPTATSWIARVGRGGDKSTMLVELGENETLFGDWKIPPGERHWFVHVTKREEEGHQRLRLWSAHLDALGEPYTRVGDTIELRNMPRGFRVLACNIGAVSGFRCFGYAADECAKWSVDGVNPAAEVLASLDAMMITHPGARRFVFSSPMATLDEHYRLVELGNTEDQIVTIGSSWEMNPEAITREAALKAAKGDQRIFRREYEAIPMAAVSAAFDPEDIDAAFREPPGGEECEPILVVDASSGRGDAFAFGICGWVHPVIPLDAWETDHLRDECGFVITQNSIYKRDEFGCPILKPEWRGKDGPALVFHRVVGVEGRFFDVLRADAIVARLASLCSELGVTRAIGDQRESLLLESGLAQHGIQFTSHAWTGGDRGTKTLAVERLRRWLTERTLVLPEHEKMRRELHAFSEKVTPSGAITYGARGAGHDDYAALCVTAAIADALGELPGSPIEQRRSGPRRIAHFEDRTGGFRG